VKLFALLFVSAALSSCEDFEHGFVDGYNRAHSADYVSYTAPETTYYVPPPQPLYHTGVINQMGQPPAIYSVGPTGGVITQMGHAPIFVSGN
jgi:hypothetical protein